MLIGIEDSKSWYSFEGFFVFSYSLCMLSRTENNNKLFFSVLDYLGFSEDSGSHFYFSRVLFPTLSICVTMQYMGVIWR